MTAKKYSIMMVQKNMARRKAFYVIQDMCYRKRPICIMNWIIMLIVMLVGLIFLLLNNTSIHNAVIFVIGIILAMLVNQATLVISSYCGKANQFKKAFYLVRKIWYSKSPICVINWITILTVMLIGVLDILFNNPDVHNAVIFAIGTLLAIMLNQVALVICIYYSRVNRLQKEWEKEWEW